MKAMKNVVVVLAMVGLLASCSIQNHDYSTLGPGSREVNAVLILDPVEDMPNVAKIRQKVLFDFDSYAALMKEHPDTILVLQGHTDKYGTNEYNQKLSENRANAVKDSLVAKGVPADRIAKVEGFGKTQLIPNLSNRENRRVLILSIGE